MQELGTVQIKIGELELRSTDDKALEIVRWEEAAYSRDPYCYTLAYWKDIDEGYDLLFVGSRPFHEGVDSSVFWYLGKTGQEMLDRLEDVE